MRREEQLLQFLAADRSATDPIRIVKGLFVFTQRVHEGGIPPQETLYNFVPMQFGPCDMAIYDDLNVLANAEAAERVPVSGETWSRFAITESGMRQANEVRARERDVRAIDFIAAVRAWCDALSFTDLVRAVYHAYPDFARNSILPHLRPNG